MRTVYVIRHAHSTANEQDGSGLTADGLAMADRAAGLTKRGVSECAALAALLPGEYGITPRATAAAVSTFVRTNRTARLTGFGRVTRYSALDESPYDVSLAELRAMLRRNRIPELAVRTAEARLRQAPPEAVWVTHGLLIAGMCTALGMTREFERLTPRQCEVRRLTF